MRAQEGQQKYLNDVFGLNDPDLLSVHRQLEQNNLAFMSLSAAEGRILQFLIRAFALKKVVEVGTLLAHSALCMAKALPEDGVLISLEQDPQRFAMAQENIKAAKHRGTVRLLLGDALAVLPTLEAVGPFDMVFIDANKSAYVDYLNWAEANVRLGGLIVGDNSFLFGALWGESTDRNIQPAQIQVMREFNARLADPQRYNSILIPTLNGLTVAQKLF